MNFHSWNLEYRDLFLKEWHPNKNQNMWFKHMMDENIWQLKVAYAKGQWENQIVWGIYAIREQ